jgi:YHS domain-containing protein
MAVEAERADAAGLRALHGGADFYFCGRGCLLDFGEDPDRYLAPDYLPAI